MGNAAWSTRERGGDNFPAAVWKRYHTCRVSGVALGTSAPSFCPRALAALCTFTIDLQWRPEGPPDDAQPREPTSLSSNGSGDVGCAAL